MKCKKCGEIFASAQQLKVHTWAKHAGPYPFSKARKPGPKKRKK